MNIVEGLELLRRCYGDDDFGALQHWSLEVLRAVHDGEEDSYCITEPQLSALLQMVAGYTVGRRSFLDMIKLMDRRDNMFRTSKSFGRVHDDRDQT